MDIAFERIMRDYSRRKTGELVGIEEARACWNSSKPPIKIGSFSEEPVTEENFHLFALWYLVSQKRASSNSATLRSKLESASLGPRSSKLVSAALAAAGQTGRSQTALEARRASREVSKSGRSFVVKGVDRKVLFLEGRQLCLLARKSEATPIGISGERVELRRLGGGRTAGSFTEGEKHFSLGGGKVGNSFMRLKDSRATIYEKSSHFQAPLSRRLREKFSCLFAAASGAGTVGGSATESLPRLESQHSLREEKGDSGQEINLSGSVGESSGTSSGGSSAGLRSAGIDGNILSQLVALAQKTPLRMGFAAILAAKPKTEDELTNLIESMMAVEEPGGPVEAVVARLRRGVKGKPLEILVKIVEVNEGLLEPELGFCPIRRIFWVKAGVPKREWNIGQAIEVRSEAGTEVVSTKEKRDVDVEMKSKAGEEIGDVEGKEKVKGIIKKLSHVKETYERIDGEGKVTDNNNEKPHVSDFLVLPSHKEHSLTPIKSDKFSKKSPFPISEEYRFTNLFSSLCAQLTNSQPQEGDFRFEPSDFDLDWVPSYLSEAEVRYFLSKTSGNLTSFTDPTYSFFLSDLLYKPIISDIQFRASIFTNYNHIQHLNRLQQNIALLDRERRVQLFPFETFGAEIMLVMLPMKRGCKLEQVLAKFVAGRLCLRSATLAVPPTLHSPRLDVHEFLRLKPEILGQLQTFNLPPRHFTEPIFQKSKSFVSEGFLPLSTNSSLPHSEYDRSLPMTYIENRGIICFSVNRRTGKVGLTVVDRKSRRNLHRATVGISACQLVTGLSENNSLARIVLRGRAEVASSRGGGERRLRALAGSFGQGLIELKTFSIGQMRGQVSEFCRIVVLSDAEGRELYFDFWVQSSRFYVARRLVLSGRDLTGLGVGGWGVGAQTQLEVLAGVIARLEVDTSGPFPRLGFRLDGPARISVFMRAEDGEVRLAPKFCVCKTVTRQVVRADGGIAVSWVFSVPPLKETWFVFYFPSTCKTFYSRMKTERFLRIYETPRPKAFTPDPIIGDFYRKFRVGHRGFPLLELRKNIHLVVQELLHCRGSSKSSSFFSVILVPQEFSRTIAEIFYAIRGASVSGSSVLVPSNKFWIVVKTQKFSGQAEMFKLSLDSAVNLLGLQRKDMYTKQELRFIAKKLVDLKEEYPTKFAKLIQLRKTANKATRISTEVVLYPKRCLLSVSRKHKDALVAQVFDFDRLRTKEIVIERSEYEELHISEQDLHDPKTGPQLRRRLINFVRSKGI